MRWQAELEMQNNLINGTRGSSTCAILKDSVGLVGKYVGQEFSWWPVTEA